MARSEKKYDLALKYLDTLYGNIIYLDDWNMVFPLYYSGLKFMEGEILLEKGELNTALIIFKNLEMDFTGNYIYTQLHGPIKFRLGFIYDLLGEKQKSFDYFKYFVAIYRDCDEFYQQNVQYARERITYYNKSIQ